MKLLFAGLLTAVLLDAAVLGSNYGFTYGYTDSGDTFYIDGPNGVELFDFGFHVDRWGTPLINRYGELVSFVEATQDPAIMFAIYGSGGYTGRFTGGNGAGYIGETPGNAIFGALGWEINSPVGDDPDNPIWPSPEGQRGVPVSISDTGLVTGEIARNYPDDAVRMIETVTWQLADFQPRPMAGGLVSRPQALITIPEPGVLLFTAVGLGLLFAAKVGR